MQKQQEYCAVIGRRVKTARQNQKITQEELADRVGVSWSSISRLETGSNMTSVKTLLEIAKTLQINVQYFFCDFVETEEMEAEATVVEITTLLQGMDPDEKKRLIEYIRLTVGFLKKE